MSTCNSNKILINEIHIRINMYSYRNLQVLLRKVEMSNFQLFFFRLTILNQFVNLCRTYTDALPIFLCARLYYTIIYNDTVCVHIHLSVQPRKSLQLSCKAVTITYRVLLALLLMLVMYFSSSTLPTYNLRE